MLILKLSGKAEQMFRILSMYTKTNASKTLGDLISECEIEDQQVPPLSEQPNGRLSADMAWLLESIGEIKETKPLIYTWLQHRIKQMIGTDFQKWSEAIKALPGNKLEEFCLSVQKALEL